MALTGAERQARYMARLKAKAAGDDPPPFVSSACYGSPIVGQIPTPWPPGPGGGGGGGLNIKGVVPVVGDLPTDARYGDVWLVQSNNHGHFWDGTAWQDIGPIFTGPQGPAGTVTVGTTTTGAPGTNAIVTQGGTPQARILNFTIPRGDQGDPGVAEGITMGNTPPVAPDPGEYWFRDDGIFRWMAPGFWMQVGN